MRLLLAAAVLTVIAVSCGGSGDAGPTESPSDADSTFVGADGIESVVTDTSRVITLSGDLTEFVYALGRGASVVAVDVTTVHPAEATELPVVGVGRFLSAEAVLSHEPSLVIGDTQTAPLEAIAQIRATGVPVVILEVPTSFAALYAKIDDLGRLLGEAEPASDLRDRIRTDVEREQARVTTAGLRIAYLYTRGPDVNLLFGAGMVTNPLIEAAGGVDAGADAGIEGSVPVTAEALVAAAPDVIIVPSVGFEAFDGIEGLLAIPGVAQTPAGRSGSILAYPEGDFLTFGPRVAETLHALITDLAD